MKLTNHQHAVVKVTNAEEIAKTLKFAKAKNIPVVVKGGGHSTSGSSAIDDGLVIDLSKMRKVIRFADCWRYGESCGCWRVDVRGWVWVIDRAVWIDYRYVHSNPFISVELVADTH